MNSIQTYRWEQYPEYLALRQYGRCLGAVLASAPVRVRLKASGPLVRAAVTASTGLAGAHAEHEPGDPYSAAREEREEFRRVALEAIQLSRTRLAVLKGFVSASHLTAALELLERAESGIRARPLPSQWRNPLI